MKQDQAVLLPWCHRCSE